MTAVVTKGTNRPAHAARTTKHAQRTPLPAKGADTFDVSERERIAKGNEERAAFVAARGVNGFAVKGQGTTAVVHWGYLEKTATGDRGHRHLLQVCGTSSKQRYTLTILNEARYDETPVTCKKCVAKYGDGRPTPAVTEEPAPCEWEGHADAMAEHGICLVCDPGEPKPKPRKRTKAAKSTEEPTPEPVVDEEASKAETAENTKAHRQAATFVGHGWAVAVQVEDGYAELTATRGTETIHQAWMNGVYHNDSASYTIGDRTVKTRNVAEALRWAARTPEAAEAEFAKVGANTSFRRKAVEPERKALPFDPKTETDEGVAVALSAATVTWHNRFSQLEETALMPLDARRIRIEEQHGERVVLFCCSLNGFRAFRLSDLTSVRVGGSVRRRRTAKPAEAEETEAA